MKSVRANIPISELEKMGFLCAWNGCEEKYPIKDGLPADWVNLMVFGGQPSPRATMLEVSSRQDCYRDTVLCPKHATEFLQVHLRPLPPIGRE